LGFWLEVVTLVVPGFNDSAAELRAIAEFLAGISRDIPWHVTAFHQDYKMPGPDNTPPDNAARRRAHRQPPRACGTSMRATFPAPRPTWRHALSRLRRHG